MSMLSSRYLKVIVAATMVCATGQAHADSSHFARIASDSITPFLVIGEATLLSTGKQEAVQGAKAVVYTGLATELLKNTVRDKRPNSDSRTSFPSGHTSSAFAMATAIADYKPRLAIPAYATAAIIGWSRVEVHAHKWDDVVVGAALGYFTAKHFTHSRLSISPQGVSYNLKW